jgi:hypothetical protein
VTDVLVSAGDRWHKPRHLLICASKSQTDIVMRDPQDTAVNVRPTSALAARSRRLHDAFEAYYAEHERRRLADEARARRDGSAHGGPLRVPAAD